MPARIGLAIIVLVLAVFALVVAPSAEAGDRSAVLEALRSLPTNWPGAQLSVELDGISKDGEILIDQPLRVSYEAAVSGYVTYLHVSSHGDMTLFRESRPAAPAFMGVPLEVKPPLGRHHMIVLLSNQPLDALFPNGESVTALGADRQSAVNFVDRLANLEHGPILVASRNRHYTVIARDEVSQGQTRSIVRTVEAAGGQPVAVRRRIEFEFNSDRLEENSKLALDNLGEALTTDLKSRHVVLEGHTDAVGTEAYNMELSQRRAEAAKQYLTSNFGIPASRLTPIGKGTSAPLMPNDTEANRSANRRVEFIFDGVPAAKPN